MRIVCSNCGTSYRIKDDKLTRKVNRATCRKCKSVILIKKEDPPVADGVPGDDEEVDDEPTVDRQTFEQQKAEPAGVDHTEDEDDGAPTSLMRKEDIAKALADHAGTDEVPVGDERSASEKLSRSFPPPSPAPPRATPAPVAPPVGTPMPQRSHDPTGDMKVAFAGSAIAVLGVLILVLSGDDAAHLVGLFAALWGAALAAVVLITSGFGTKHGSIVGAFVLSLLFAGGVSGIVVMVAPAPAPAPAPETAAVEAPEAPEAPAEAATGEATDEGPTEGEAAEEATEEPPAEEAGSERDAVEPAEEISSADVAAPDRLRPSGSGTELANGGSSTPDRAAQPAETAPAPASPVETPDEVVVAPTLSQAGATGRDSVDRAEFEEQMNSSSGIKRCLYKYRTEFGSMPTGRIPVTVRINADGSVSSARITGGEYQGTSLDTCFGSSIRSITFSAFDGPTAVESYTFTL